MGYRDHYADTTYTVLGVYTAEDANRLLKPEVDIVDGVVLVLSDEGNQERFVIEGSGEDIQIMLRAGLRALLSVRPDLEVDLS